MKNLLKKFKFKTAKTPDLSKYIGSKVTINGEPVTIEKIVGNLTKPAFYEINSEHLIGMLRFHAQILGDHSITEEQFKAFEEIQFEVERVAPPEQKKQEDQA
jgi:hypothetical protein